MDDLDDQFKVVFKFLKRQYKKCYEVAPDDKFKIYLDALSRNFDTKNV